MRLPAEASKELQAQLLEESAQLGALTHAACDCPKKIRSHKGPQGRVATVHGRVTFSIVTSNGFSKMHA